jgi:hypothetical protein
MLAASRVVSEESSRSLTPEPVRLKEGNPRIESATADNRHWSRFFVLPTEAITIII